MSKHSGETGSLTIGEMREFAGFSARTQRYIRRSIDVGFNRGDALKRWSRDEDEGYSVKAQQLVYTELKDLRERIPSVFDFDVIEPFLAPLIKISAFDLGQDGLEGFSAYQFLYERLIGANARPWFPGAFCAAAALPHLQPSTRKTLLQSISEQAATAPRWSTREPLFYPEWVEKEAC